MASALLTDQVSKLNTVWGQDVDTAVYNYLTSVSGTNTITATGPVGLAAYAAGLKFRFIPAATNTGATTINITGTGALGARNIFYNGVACTGGELVIGRPVEISDDGTRFHIIGPMVSPSPITNSLSADVNLNNTANYFTGPTVAQGTTGIWFVSGSVQLEDTAGSAGFLIKLWDGTTIISSCRIQSSAVGVGIQAHLSGFITSPAGNLRISVKDETSTNGVMDFNRSGNSKDCTITAIRIG